MSVPPPSHRPVLGLALGLLGTAVFAGTLPFTRLAVAGLDPWFVTAGRAAVAGVLSGATLLALRRPPPSRRVLAELALAALCLAGAFPALIGFALRSVDASHGGVVLGVLPLATAGMSAALTGERPTAAFWAAALGGAALVTAFALMQAGGTPSLGDGLLALAVLASALGYVLSGRLARAGLRGWEVISWILVVALPATLPAALLTAPRDPVSVPASAWIGFAYAALMSQYLGFFAWNAGLALGGIARVAQVQLLQTFLTLGLAALLNGERVGPAAWIVALAVVLLVLAAGRARVVAARSPNRTA